MLKRLRRWFWNQLALRHDYVKVWLDDEREAPRGWYHALTAPEAMGVLQSCYVTHLSLDHDLGHTFTGYDLVKWLAEYREAMGLNFWPFNKPTIHSANPVGRENMQSVINRYGPYGGKN